MEVENRTCEIEHNREEIIRHEDFSYIIIRKKSNDFIQKSTNSQNVDTHPLDVTRLPLLRVRIPNSDL